MNILNLLFINNFSPSLQILQISPWDSSFLIMHLVIVKSTLQSAGWSCDTVQRRTICATYRRQNLSEVCIMKFASWIKLLAKVIWWICSWFWVCYMAGRFTMCLSCYDELVILYIAFTGHTSHQEAWWDCGGHRVDWWACVHTEICKCEWAQESWEG
jgi:hypothetical protein